MGKTKIFISSTSSEGMPMYVNMESSNTNMESSNANVESFGSNVESHKVGDKKKQYRVHISKENIDNPTLF